MHLYEIRPRKDKRGFDLISDALPFGRLWYGDPNAVSNAIGYAEHRSRSHRAVIEMHEATAGVDEVKLVYAKNAKWLLSGPHQLQKFAQ